MKDYRVELKRCTIREILIEKGLRTLMQESGDIVSLNYLEQCIEALKNERKLIKELEKEVCKDAEERQEAKRKLGIKQEKV